MMRNTFFKHLILTTISAGVLTPVFTSTPALAACSYVPVVAHRGGTEKYVENTRKAFQYASSIGANKWETDVQFDVTDVPFIMHDPTLDRTTNGTGYIKDQDLSAARAAGLRTNDGQYVPTLYEVLTDAASLGAEVFVELKTVPTANQLSKFLARFDWTNMRANVIVMSFYPEAIAEVKTAAPDIKLGLLEDVGYRTITDLEQYGVGNYIKNFNSMTAARLDEWSGPLNVYAWTPDSSSDWAWLNWYTSEPGSLDGIITNKPGAYLSWAKSACKK